MEPPQQNCFLVSYLACAHTLSIGLANSWTTIQGRSGKMHMYYTLLATEQDVTLYPQLHLYTKHFETIYSPNSYCPDSTRIVG